VKENDVTVKKKGLPAPGKGPTLKTVLSVKRALPVVQAKSWSFSRYSDYQQCPLRFRLRHLDKLAEPSGPALAHGAAVHELAEKYIKGALPEAVPGELEAFADLFRLLRAQYAQPGSGVYVEDSWCFTRDWARVNWDDWDRVAVRLKLDCAWHEDPETLIIADWKTGRWKAGQAMQYEEQLSLYALGALLVEPQVKVVKPRLVYLDPTEARIYPPEATAMNYTRKDLEPLKKAWMRRATPLLSDTIFAPTPNQWCNFCHYRAANKANGGGQCKF
jgi:putative RecB family exonuclease